ncbi:MAG: biopolymer transporter ExbD [Lentisphaeraceae bacterium]|nr:biopolymer transporter ExbD [Lentisphaeraceae bacterium]
MRCKSEVRIFRGRLSLAPLVDVMFILTIFLLISTSYDFQPGFEVELPEAKAPLVRGDKLVVVIVPRNEDSKESLIFFNNEEVSWDELEVRLAEMIHQRSQPSAEDNLRKTRLPILSLRAHKDIPYGNIMRVNSLAYKLRVKVNLVTADPQTANK